MTVDFPNASPADFAHLDELFSTVRGLPPRTVAVVQPISSDTLRAALEAAQAGLIRPILVGEAERIRALAEAEGMIIGEVPVVDAADDVAAAACAVDLARSGEADMIMKGHIHSDEFLRPMLDRARGLRTLRMMSHAFVCYLPRRVYPKPLLLTDAAMNLAPDLAAKRAILQNVIDLAHALGIAEPRVAVLAATETVNPLMQATIDARALRDAYLSGEISGAIVDGPLAFDNALSRECARNKGIDSPVSGEPDILLIPNIEAGNMLYKQMVHFIGAITPGLVLGGIVPVIMNSRAEPRGARLASCALALAYASARPLPSASPT